tara:strand:- start:273 stop:695 length:423 start_codon:yes stop_codon:yes gene_type:complete
MDDATAKELGLEALAVGFEWAGGAIDGRTRERYEDGDGAWVVNKWPDFRDPATLGVLLGQFVAAWQPTATRNGATDEQWRAYKRALSLVARWAGGDSTVGDELAEALVAALPSNWQCPACGTLHIKAPASFKCPCGTHRG